MATTKYSLMDGGIADDCKTVAVALTNVVTTTAEIALGPYTLGGVSNESGGALTLTLSAASEQGGTSLALDDTGGTAVAALTVADDAFHAIESAATASVPYLIVLSNAVAATGVKLHFKRR